jgi:hypothetical protein
MAEAPSAASDPGPRSRHVWRRALGRAVVVVIVLLVVLYFVVTSPAFFQRQILPRVSTLLNAKVTVSSAEIHPFSQVVLHDLTVQPTNQAPVVTAKEVRVKYSLFDVMGGDYRVDEAVLVSPVIEIVRNPDGTSNLDPLSRALMKQSQKPSRRRAASRPPRVDIRKLMVSDGTFREIQNQKAGTRNLVELTNVDFTVSEVKNGGSGKLEFSCTVRDENNPPAPAMYGLLRAKVEGSFDFRLTPELTAESVLGDAHLAILHAAGSFSDFGKLDGKLHCDVSATQFNVVTLNFEKSGMRMGELRATGPYDAQKAEGRLNVELLSVDRQVLNLFGARYGIDFGSTTMTSTNTMEFGKAGAAISVAGQLRASKFQLGRTNETTPPLDLRADYNISIDKAEKTALLRTLNVTGTQNGRPLVRGELTSPMTLAWGNETNAVGDSSLNVGITRLNLADWKSFVGDLASSGTLDLNMSLLSQQGGRELTFDTTNHLDGLTTDLAGQHISDATIILRARGRATDLKEFDLKHYRLEFLRSNQVALAISGSGVYDRSNADADLQVSVRASLPRTFRVLNRPDLEASAGVAEVHARFRQMQQTQTITGNLTLTNFTGTLGKNEFRNFGAAMDLDLQKTPAEIDFRSVVGKLSVSGNPAGGNFDLSGTYSLSNKPSDFTLAFSDLDQESLRPFLEPLLTDKRLASVLINGAASAQVDAKGNSTVKADVQVSNLVLNATLQQVRSTPIDARVRLDAFIAKHITDVRQLEIELTPTKLAKNEFQVQGRVDVSKPDAIKGNLKLTSDSLDLTSYYELFNATNKVVVKASGNGRNRTQTTAVAPPPEQEAATNRLPFANFVLEANVREFYLREVAATNFQAKAILDGSHVLLKPLQFTMSGSPVSATADVDMSLPGWKYALTFNTTNIPYAPLWNTLYPESEGEVGGTLTAYGNINGIGTSGESLQKTMTGEFHIGTTNLNLQVPTMHSRLLRGTVEIVAGVLDIFENPASALNFAGNIVFGKLNGGLAREVEESPIDVIEVDGTAGNGQVILRHALVRSAAFEATTTNGSITLAPVLTNSTIDIPIGIALNRTIAQRTTLFGSLNTQTNNNYVKLPDFFSETGTIGNPKKSINGIALTEGVIEKAIPGLGIAAASTVIHPLEGIGELLKGESATNQVATNQVPTNQVSTNTLFSHSPRAIGK